jgi:hypothetical protein
MSDPKRILETGSTRARELLGAHPKSMAPPISAEDEVWKALQAKLPPPNPSGPGGANAVPAGKLVGAVALVGALFALAFFALRPEHAAPNESAPTAPERTVISVPTLTIEAKVKERDEPAPAATEPAAIVHSTRIAAPPVTASASASQKPADPEEEAAVVREARAVLRQGDAAGALARLDSYERTYRGGILGQERAFLRIEAMRAAGDPRAKDRIDAFLKAYPDSPYRDRIQPK